MHFRQRRDGSFLHGTVTDTDPNGKWCYVRWDGNKPNYALVTVECLIASMSPAEPLKQKEESR